MKTSMEMTDFDRLCLERIPPDKLREFHERAVADTKRIFEGDRELMLPKGFCSHCATNALITPLIFDIERGETWCASCWLKKKEQDYCFDYIINTRPKLDYEDFIRL